MANEKAVHEFEVETIDGKKLSLSQYKDQVLLIVNVASECGFTSQYTELEEVQKKFKGRGFQVLGFPCNQFGSQEPGSNAEIKTFCETKFKVTFPLFAKIDVNGPNAHPLFEFLKQSKRGFLGTEGIKWNFTKFLIGKNGQVIDRFASTTKPTAIEDKIEAALSH